VNAPAAIRTSTRVCAGGMPAHLAVPENDGLAPCVIVIHERYGLVRHIKEIAERFAREGYVAIAPDLFYKHPDPEALHRGDSGYELTDPQALVGLEAAIAVLAQEPRADTRRIAAMGICQTGRHPLVLAAHRPMSAALVWYGSAQPREWVVNARYTRPLDEIISAVDCPVLGVFGEIDNLISIEDVRKFRGSLEKHGKSFDICVYPSAPHGFLNDTMPGRYRRPEAEAAWERQMQFLKAAVDPDRNQSRRVQTYSADIGVGYDFSSHVRFE
jgi:carboxymethylenebutenolidase